MAELKLHRRVHRYARKLPVDLRDKVKASLAKLAEDPDGYPGSIRMAGQWQGYRRIRIGDLRAIYVFRPEEGVVYVDYLGPRGEIYKR